MSILDSLRPTSDLRVLVTAGASGVGAAIARAFNEAGARVQNDGEVHGGRFRNQSGNAGLPESSRS